MAELRINPGAVPAVARPQAPARIEAARASQAAFFQAALNQAQGATAASPMATQPPGAPAKADQAGEAQRLLRPGSLLDIKV